LYGKKKGCPRERNLRKIYTENTIKFCLLSVFLCCFCLNIIEYEQISGRGGGAKFTWPQGHKIPKYGPAGSTVLPTQVVNKSSVG
jgi:hypothetical protein